AGRDRGARDGARGPARARARRGARPAGLARQGHRLHRRAERQHRAGAPPARLHVARGAECRGGPRAQDAQPRARGPDRRGIEARRVQGAGASRRVTVSSFRGKRFMQKSAWAFACSALFLAATFDTHAELVRCTSKDGKSSVIRKDKCDSPDDIRTPVTAKQGTRADPAAAPAGESSPIADAMAAYNAGDYARARQTFEPLATKGDPLAQIMMGDMYRNGNGVPKDDRIAYTWIRKAADQGDARGQAALAALMQAGRGTPRDDAGAVMWLQKSANQGFAIAQVALAMTYLNG